MTSRVLPALAALILLAGCRPERAGGRIELEFAPHLERGAVAAVVPELEASGLRLWRFEVEPGAGRAWLSVSVERDAQTTLDKLVRAVERSGRGLSVRSVRSGRFRGLREEREVVLLGPEPGAAAMAELVQSRAEAAGARGLSATASGESVRVELPTAMSFGQGLDLCRAPEFGLFESPGGARTRTVIREAAERDGSTGLRPALLRLAEAALATDGEPEVEEAELAALSAALGRGAGLSDDWRLLPGSGRSGRDARRITVRLVRRTAVLGRGAFEGIGAIPYTGPDTARAGQWHLALTLDPSVVPAFAALSRGIVGSRLAVVLDGLVLAAPQVSGPLRDSVLVIAVPGLDSAGATALARALALAAGRPVEPVAAGTFSYREFRAD